jgi:hypothetical protein
MKRFQMMALGAAAVVSAAAKAYSPATAGPIPTPTPRKPTNTEIDRLLKKMRDALDGNGMLLLNLKNDLADVLGYVNRNASPAPSPTPDPQKVYRDLQKLMSKEQQMQDILGDIIKKYNETCKGIVNSIGR